MQQIFEYKIFWSILLLFIRSVIEFDFMGVHEFNFITRLKLTIQPKILKVLLSFTQLQ